MVDTEELKKRRRKKRRQENRRQKREERRFIFSVVVHGRSLLMECFFCLLPFARAFSASWPVNSFFYYLRIIFYAVTVFIFDML